MPGTFAHITLATSLCGSEELDRAEEIPKFVKLALGQQSKFCELGAVSPDYPYLALRDADAAGWANVMHYWKTADFLRRGVGIFCEGRDLRSSNAQKCISWLFGYASHVVADLTIHPVIEQIVGPYAENKTDHRVCELHQDAYIFNKRVGLELTKDEYLRHSGIRDCGEKLDDTHHLDAAVRQLWVGILQQIPLGLIEMPGDVRKPGAAPDPDKWHHSYVTGIDNFAEEGGNFPLLRGLFETKGWIFPSLAHVQPQYIGQLKMPGGGTTSYDDLFERATNNVLEVWRQLGAAITQANPERLTLANANLDTGKADDARSDDAPLFWNVRSA